MKGLTMFLLYQMEQKGIMRKLNKRLFKLRKQLGENAINQFWKLGGLTRNSNY